MDLNLFINIFKKEPGNIPPQAGSAQGRSGGEWQGKRQADKDFIFCLIKVCFILSRKTRKARKSSEFGIPNSTSLDEHKVLASCSLLTSQQLRTEQDNANVRNDANREAAL